MKKLFALLALFISMFLLPSCDKNIERNVCYLLNEYQDDVLTASFAFNDDNQVTSLMYYNDNGELSWSETRNYDANGLLDVTEHFSSNGNSWYKIQYEYPDDETITTRHFDIASNITVGSQYVVYQIDHSASCPLVKAEYYDKDENLMDTQMYNYSNSNCDRTNEYDFGSEIISVDIKNDNKKGAFYWITLPQFQGLSRYNIVEYTRTRDNEVQENVSFTTTYEYNRQGYPVKATRAYLDGTEHTLIYEYDCQ